MAVSLRIENLTKRFGAAVAADNVSMSIEPGEIFFLLGPSGCGKTTVLRSIAGFCRPDSGRIFIGEEDITELPPHLRETGMVFQSYALWPHLTVAENVAFGLEMRRVSKSELRIRVDEALDMVRMREQSGRKPNQLSGGQQQRVALARALVVRPRCLLLDEPLSNLDAKLRLEMRSEIRRICKQAGLTAIYVTHDQKEALSVADRLAVMEQGRVCQIGTPWSVYRNPVSRFVAAFVGETNIIEGRIESIAPDGCVVETALGRFSSANRPPEGLKPGSRVAVSARPECFKIGRDPSMPGGANSFAGILRESVYLGETAQYKIEIGEVLIKALELNPREAGCGIGKPVSLSVDPSDVAVLPE